MGQFSENFRESKMADNENPQNLSSSTIFQAMDRGKSLMQEFESTIISIKNNETNAYNWLKNLSEEDRIAVTMFLINEHEEFGSGEFFE